MIIPLYPAGSIHIQIPESNLNRPVFTKGQIRYQLWQMERKQPNIFLPTQPLLGLDKPPEWWLRVSLCNIQIISDEIKESWVILNVLPL